MFAGVYWLTEELEKGFFALLDALILAKGDAWDGDWFGVKAVELFFEVDADAF